MAGAGAGVTLNTRDSSLEARGGATEAGLQDCRNYVNTWQFATMLPFRQIGAPKPEQWVGLVDAVYAIAMTVLALLLPDMLSESFKLFEKTQNTQFLWIGFYQAGFYFSGLLILYEAWCFHRSILVLSNNKNRTQTVYTGLLLGIVCLVPAWSGAVLEGIDHSQFWIESKLQATLGTFGWLLIFLMYLLLYLIGRSSTEFHDLPNLRLISKEAKNRSIFFAMVTAFHAVRIVDKQWPFVPVVLILSVYVLISFNQDRATGVLRAIPNALSKR
jgi:uncharacterized membrane protein